jgi:hypothetical protein
VDGEAPSPATVDGEAFSRALMAGEAAEEVWRNWFLRAYRNLQALAEDKAG